MPDEIKSLTDYAHIRIRPEMYLGSRSIAIQNILIFNEALNTFEIQEIKYVPAVLTSFREALDNAIDITIAKKSGNRIDIDYNEQTGKIKVRDYGKGISLNYNKEHQMFDVTLALTKLRTGSNFTDNNRVGAGMNGLGISCVVSVSKYFNVRVRRGKQEFYQEYRTSEKELIINEPIIKKFENTQDEWKHGTEVEFQLDELVFNDRTLPDSLVKTLIKQIAMNNPKISFYYNNKLVSNENILKNCNSINITISNKENQFVSNYYIIPNFIETKNNETDKFFYFSLANNIPLFNGGSHVDIFNSLFFSGLINELKVLWKKEKVNNVNLEPKKADIQQGLLIYNTTQMLAPYFDSQSKTRLINEDIVKYIKNYFKEFNWKEFTKNNKNWVENLKKSVVERMELQGIKELKQKQKKLLKRSIPKLRDANSTDRSICELFLCEGDSAAAGGMNVRNPKTQAFMSLGGKIPNVYDMSPLQVHNSIKINNILSAVGLFIGEPAIREKLRYKYIYIATDMDSDGSSIASELVNFFFHYWPELFNKEDPFLRILMTPFIIAEKGKEKKYWFLDNIKEFDIFDKTGWHITRAKGLGTLEKADWDYVIQNPRYIEVIDEGNIANLLKLVFKEDQSDSRKKWMTFIGENMEDAIKSDWKFEEV